jgi:CubicO group peptidase (beta-lactamase class C family)
LISTLIINCFSAALIFGFPKEIDSRKLEEALFRSFEIGSLKCIIIARGDSVIKETYRGNSGAFINHDVRSVTKSVTSLLIGIAIDKGFIKSTDQPISDFLDTNYYELNYEKSRITIKQLLTMTGGFVWDETFSTEDYNRWINSVNQAIFLFERPLKSEPGKEFNYNSAALHLLSLVISSATKNSALLFAQKFLFDPLEIQTKKWSQDKQGFNNGSAGLELTPYDMLKIGSLVLNKGVYKRKRIVSEKWINESTAPKIRTNNPEIDIESYGYGWWIGSYEEHKFILANGWGGQFILIFPDSGLIIIATNEWKNINGNTANYQWLKTMNLIRRKILPVFYN